MGGGWEGLKAGVEVRGALRGQLLWRVWLADTWSAARMKPELPVGAGRSVGIRGTQEAPVVVAGKPALLIGIRRRCLMGLELCRQLITPRCEPWSLAFVL